MLVKTGRDSRHFFLVNPIEIRALIFPQMGTLTLHQLIEGNLIRESNTK